MAWMNEDGLYVKFGPEKGASLVDAGDIKTFNADGDQVLTLEVNLAELTTAEQILSDVVWLPKNAQITYVKSVCEVAGQTGTSIDVGLVQADRSTELDYDGLLAAFPLSGNYDAAGDTVIFTGNATIPTSVVGTGALIGTILSSTSDKYYVTASYAAGDPFTAGRLRLSIGYRPSAVADNAN
jgi:hypothetical protein